MSADFDFTEVVQLAGMLHNKVVSITGDVESKVLSEVGRRVQADAIAAAPRDTGDLAASIYLRAGKGWRVVGSDLKQGFFQEFGTSRHPPQPWLFPVGDRGGDELADLLEKIADPLR